MTRRPGSDTSPPGPGGLSRGLAGALAAAQLWLAGSTAYLLALLAAGSRDQPSLPEPESAPATAPWIAVLVPAHDEQAGVAATVQALVGQDYPAGRHEVIVIADNCTDRTAETAARAGATVWAREDPGARGKGQALGWALRRLAEQPAPAEIVAVVDADCIASPNLCAAIAREMADPAVPAVQVRYEVSNADESPEAALRAAGFILRHVIRSRGRARLGLSCGLFGSGMAFRRALLHELGWPTSVTEDTELHLRLVARGLAVRFNDRAVVRSRMPTTASGAAEQQLRWETGNAELAQAQVLRLVVHGLASGNRQLLGAAELLVPSQSLLAAGSLAVGAAAAGLGRRRLAALAGATLAAQATYVLGGLLVAGAPPASLRALAHVPGFVCARLRVLGRVASGRRAQSWVRTARES